ncbi:hypothetical protein QLX08_002096 [Tetragonisca angustula]|uniref:Uncharacterized protein n=1 Tax=Tetragonisca angustula TaxID=166442 RepID=A0AAW1AD23_9HYME
MEKYPRLIGEWSLLALSFANILSGDKADSLSSAASIEVEATGAIQHPGASSYVSGACRYRNSVNYIAGGRSHSDERPPVSAAIATNGASIDKAGTLAINGEVGLN